MGLYDRFNTLLSSSSDVALSSYLSPISKHIKEIEDCSENNELLKKYCNELSKILENEYALLDGENINNFFQKFGEAHFLNFCLKKEVNIERVPEESKKTPDFKYKNNEVNAHFEVKTLSIVDGKYNLNQDLENILDMNIHIKEQLNEGKKFAFGETVISPYGAQEVNEKPMSKVISTLLRKTENNIKADQYIGENTFLVLNLSLINPYSTDTKTLCSTYFDDYSFPKPLSGDLWMLAFGQIGMLIHGQPEFEGKPCIEGLMDQVGILVNEDYKNIAGLLIMVYPSPSELIDSPLVYGLYRNKDYEKWNDENSGLLEILYKITGNNWNDEKDHNIWNLVPE